MTVTKLFYFVLTWELSIMVYFYDNRCPRFFIFYKQYLTSRNHDKFNYWSKKNHINSEGHLKSLFMSKSVDEMDFSSSCIMEEVWIVKLAHTDHF